MATTTVDMTALSAQHTSEAANRRSKARHWAEWRLKAYGILAISLAAIALLILISTVVTKATTVVYEYYVQLDTRISASDAEIERLRDPNPRARVGMDKVARNALQAKVERELTRSERRDLGRLLSTDAGLELGDAVKADMGLLGQRYLYPALLDDEVQMYFKGALGRLKDAGTQGRLVLKELGDEIQLEFAPGAMEVARESLAVNRAASAKAALAEVARQENAIQATRKTLAAAATDEDRASAQATLDSFTQRRDQAADKARAFEQEAQDANTIFTLTDEDPSVLIRMGGGWLKLQELGPTTAKAEVMEPLDITGSADEGEWHAEFMERPEISRNLNDRQVVWIETLNRSGFISQKFNWRLLQQSDSSNAELGGYLGRYGRFVLDDDRDLWSGLPDWRHGLDLSRGVCAKEPDHGLYRGQHQQPGCGSFDRLRSVRDHGADLGGPVVRGAAF